MKQSYLIIQNNNGETVRTVPYQNESLEIIYRHDLKRIEFSSDTEDLTENQIEFESIGQIEKNCHMGLLKKGQWGQIKHVESVEAIAHDAQERKEKNRDFLFFLKWTAGIQVGLLILLIGLAWILKEEQPEQQIVEIIPRTELKEKTPVVQMTKNPKETQKVVTSKNKKINKVAHNANRKVITRNTRSGNELKKMGALSALGGFSPSSKGLGGLSNSSSKSMGFGFDSNRAAGGNSRGMLGAGLVQSGIGSGQKLNGYGGYGTSGKGSGSAGYGFFGKAGQSSGYYLPLSDSMSIEGGLDPDQVNAVVERNLNQVRYCYEKGLQTSPNLSGKVSVHFIIAPNGAVRTSKVVHSSIDSNHVEKCISGKLMAWRFPRPKGNVSVTVTYPFTLQRSNRG